MGDVRKCWIAFVDILGFGQFCENNTPEELGRILTSTLLKVPAELREVHLASVAPGMKRPELTFELVWKPKHLVISDSILFYQTPHFDEDEETRRTKLAMFCSYVGNFTQLMMAAGLPVRGAISYGSFYLEDNIAAGKPIIDAYKEGNELQFSGVVFAQSCEKELLAYVREKDLGLLPLLKLKGVSMGRKLDVPLRKDSKSRFVLFSYDPNDFKDFDDSVRYPPFENDETICKSLFASFAAHGKGSGPEVISKIENTARAIAQMIE